MTSKKNPLEIAGEIFSIYNLNENLALKYFPNYKLRAFYPITFSRYNFPISANAPEEIFKYLDTMQENQINKHYFNDLDGYLLHDEMKAIENIATSVSTYAKFFNKRTVPIGIGGMISSISTIRSLLAIQKQKQIKKLNVIEIGSGSGMLGLLANYFNINYTSFDVTNAFAVQVCTLYKFLFDKDFLDLSSIPCSSNFDREKTTAKASDDNIKWLNEKIQEDNKMTFIPWWHFLNEENINLPRYDLVIMNHCFFEIKEIANRYILKRFNQNDERQLVLSSYWGSSEFTGYTDNTICNLELEFNIRQEKIISSNNVYIPKTITLFSYENSVKFRNFEFFGKNINQRLGFEAINSNKNKNFYKSLKEFLKHKIILKYIPFIFHIYGFLYKYFFTKKSIPIILGKRVNEISDKYVIYSENSHKNFNKIDYKLFCSKIENIEKLNNAPSFTEDEFFCNQINNKSHS